MGFFVYTIKTQMTKKKKERKTKVGKALQKIKDGLVKVGTHVAFAPLVPLVPVMSAILNKRGIQHGKRIEDITESFYNNVVKPTGNHFDVMNFYFDEYSFDADNFDFDADLNFDEFNIIPPGVIASIVGAIINFLKGIKKKKDAGVPLSAEEHIALDKLKEVETQVDMTQDTFVDQLKHFFFSPLGIISVIVIVGGALYIVSGKGKKSS